VAVGGSDAFLGGSTTAAQLLLQGQVFIFQYSASLAQWIVRSTDQPLSQLDARYVLQQSTVYSEYIGPTVGNSTVTGSGISVPAGIKGAVITMISPGGAGGSGAVEASGTVACGGGGGGGAALNGHSSGAGGAGGPGYIGIKWLYS
jgi:hypothetical protein